MTIKVSANAGAAAPKLSALLAALTVAEEERDGWVAKCPGHDDSHASLRVTVSEDTGKVLLKCRAGCSNTKIMKAVGMTIRDLAAMQADIENARTTASTNALPDQATIATLGEQLNIWAQDLDTPMGADAMVYAAQRFGVEPDDARRLGLGVTTSLGGGPRLVVPFRDKAGHALGYQARALNNVAQIRWAGPPNPDGAAWARVGFFPAASGAWTDVIITEGPGDALTAAAVGFDAIAIRGAGLVQNDATIEQVARMLEGRTAVIAGDGDNAGRQFASLLTQALTARGIATKILEVRDGLDLADWRAEDPAWFVQGFIHEVNKLTTVTTTEATLRRWTYAFADIGGAQHLRDKLAAEGRPIRYTEAAGFMQLDRGVWVKRADGDIRTEAQKIGADLTTLYTATEKDAPEFAAQAWKYKHVVETSRGIDAVMKELKSLPGVRADIMDFDRHPHLLAARNGVIDLKTGALLPHNQALLLSRRLEHNYSPEAPAPRWQQFLAEVFPGQPTMATYLQRLVGYGITGETDEQCFVVHYGTGSNGKSIFTELQTDIFKAITTTTPFSTFEARRGDGVPNDLAALAGARLVMAPEGNQGKLMDEALLKRVTGRDLIAARFLRREFFEFRPQFLLQLSTNYRPAFKGQDEGLWRRVKLIEWSRHFAAHERDHSLPEKLLAEAEGIIAWAVAGAVEWYRAGLQEPAEVTAVTEDYRTQSDVLRDFISESSDSRYMTGPPDAFILRQELFREFQDWAQEGNYRDLEMWSARAFYRAIEERGYPSSKRNGHIGFRKIVRSPLQPAEPAPQMDVKPATKTLKGPSLEDLPQ